MIEIEEISVRGLSADGPFSGTLKLSSGLQVVSAKNGYGKSLAAKAIAWYLAVEPMFGISDNQPVCFPEAARDRIDFGDGIPCAVISSECSLLLKHHDGRKMRLSRAIKGDCTVVKVEETSIVGHSRETILNARKDTMQDSTGGLQNFMFEWLGWPRERVTTYKGTSEIYLENLAPLFDIDQAEG
jgi:hypothetical protein